MRSVHLGIVWGILSCAGAAQAQTVSHLAEHVPASALLAMVSADVGQTCAQFQQTRLGQTFTGQDFQPLVAELRRRQRGGPLHLRPIVGFDWVELQQVHDPGGLCLFPVPDGQLGFAWVFGGTPAVGDEGPLAVAAKYFSEQGFHGEIVERPSVVLTLFSPPAEKKDRSPRVLFVAHDFYGVANSLAAADALLNVDMGQSLAADPTWQPNASGANAAAGLSGDVAVMVRPLPLWERVRAVAPDEVDDETHKAADATRQVDDAPARDSLASSQRLGFDGLQSLVGTVSFPATGTLDWQIAVQLVAPQPYAKALRLLAFQPGPMPELPEKVAANVSSYSVWRWDVPAAMKGFGNLFDEANEPGVDGVGLFDDMLDGLRDDPEGVQVDLRREVFAQIGPEIFSIRDRQGPKSERLPNGDRTLYVAQVRDLSLLAGALTRFYAGDDRVRYVREQEYDLWTVPEGASLFIEGESDSLVSVRALAVGENRIVFGTDEEIVRSTLIEGPKSDSLKTDAAWSGLWEALQRAANNTGALWSLVRLDELLAPGYAQAITERPRDDETAQDAGPVAGLWRILLFGTAAVDATTPLAAAPSFDRVGPALPPTGATFSPAADGGNITLLAHRRED